MTALGPYRIVKYSRGRKGSADLWDPSTGRRIVALGGYGTEQPGVAVGVQVGWRHARAPAVTGLSSCGTAARAPSSAVSQHTQARSSAWRTLETERAW